MPGLLTTNFELKMQEYGFIDKSGKIIKGAFKDCDYYLMDNGYDKDGNLHLSVGPFLNINDEFSVEITIPKDKIHSYMHTKNLLEFTTLDAACKKIVEPIEKYIVATAADFTQEIYKKEDVNVFKDTKKAKELRHQTAVDFYKKKYDENKLNTPDAIFNNLKKAPKAFLTSDAVFSLISKELFNQLSKDSVRFDTPEAIVSLRAITTQTVINLMDILEYKSDKTFSDGARKFEKGLIDFDGQYETNREI